MTQHLQTMMCEYTILIIMLYIGVRCLNQRNNKIIRSFSHFVFGVIAFQIINIPVRMVDAGLVRMLTRGGFCVELRIHDRRDICDI